MCPLDLLNVPPILASFKEVQLEVFGSLKVGTLASRKGNSAIGEFGDPLDCLVWIQPLFIILMVKLYINTLALENCNFVSLHSSSHSCLSTFIRVLGSLSYDHQIGDRFEEKNTKVVI